MTPKSQIRRARRLRRAANMPEEAAWEALRTLRAHGFPVRRQHAIGRYIVDFAIVRARLAIEIDGGVHRLPQVAAADLARTQAIEAEGWRVLRVSSEDALAPDLLLARVQDELGL